MLSDTLQIRVSTMEFPGEPQIFRWVIWRIEPPKLLQKAFGNYSRNVTFWKGYLRKRKKYFWVSERSRYNLNLADPKGSARLHLQYLACLEGFLEAGHVLNQNGHTCNPADENAPKKDCSRAKCIFIHF